jgi:hypothetical protein
LKNNTAFRNGEVPLSNALCCGRATARQPSARLQALAFIYLNRRLSQDFAKFFSCGCHVTFCSAGDADRRRFRRAREGAVEQALASNEFEDRDRRAPPRPASTSVISELTLSHFTREAWFGINNGMGSRGTVGCSPG